MGRENSFTIERFFLSKWKCEKEKRKKNFRQCFFPSCCHRFTEGRPGRMNIKRRCFSLLLHLLCASNNFISTLISIEALEKFWWSVCVCVCVGIHVSIFSVLFLRINNEIKEKSNHKKVVPNVSFSRKKEKFRWEKSFFRTKWSWTSWPSCFVEKSQVILTFHRYNFILCGTVEYFYFQVFSWPISFRHEAINSELSTRCSPGPSFSTRFYDDDYGNIFFFLWLALKKKKDEREKNSRTEPSWTVHLKTPQNITGI